MSADYKYLGDFSATPPWHSRSMSCHKCKVCWTGCWDNFQCPQCGEGELPKADLEREYEDGIKRLAELKP